MDRGEGGMIGFAIRVLGPLLLISLVAGGLFLFGHSTGSASVQRKWDADKAKQVAAQLAATEQARAVEQQLQERVNDANKALQTERSKHARIAATLRADADGLRDQISGFARGGADDTATACGERAATLGALLESALRVSGECAVEAESTAADLRAVLAAWPR